MSQLEVDSVNIRFDDRKILSDIYLKVESGEVTGFLGRNGCGKSTLLKVIFGSLRGESQSVRLDGKYEQTPFQSTKVKFLPQDGLFPEFLTPAKAISLYQSDLSRLIQEEEVAGHLNMKFSELSGGIRKYVETLILLFSPCKFILLDEPFSFIAPVLVEKLIPIIREISATKGVLLTDHQYRSILEVSDKVYLLREQSIYPVSGEEELKDLGYTN
ncbi:MAG: ATP-binding cassette domain-containing protein [Cyclobacteriaceae bacterium]